MISSSRALFATPEPPDWCFQMNAEGQHSTCMWDGQQWHRTYEGGGGVGFGFGGIFVLFLVAALAMFVWRISLARRVARQHGLDPDQATELAILGDNGLEATYLAGSLSDHRPIADPATPSAGPSRPAAERLAELARLRDEGLITAAEHDERRKAILDSL
jgi:hypothetical protein